MAHVTSAAGVGRPRLTWSLTAKGHGRFPDTHAQMTVELIEAVRSEFGEAGLARLIDRRERAMAVQYQQRLRGAGSLAERIERLAALRSAEGYMAESPASTMDASSSPRTIARSVRQQRRAKGFAARSWRCSRSCWHRRGSSGSNMRSRVRDAAAIW